MGNSTEVEAERSNPPQATADDTVKADDTPPNLNDRAVNNFVPHACTTHREHRGCK